MHGLFGGVEYSKENTVFKYLYKTKFSVTRKLLLMYQIF